MTENGCKDKIVIIAGSPEAALSLNWDKIIEFPSLTSHKGAEISALGERREFKAGLFVVR